jgi:hypothetical protein
VILESSSYTCPGGLAKNLFKLTWLSSLNFVELIGPSVIEFNSVTYLFERVMKLSVHELHEKGIENCNYLFMYFGDNHVVMKFSYSCLSQFFCSPRFLF